MYDSLATREATTEAWFAALKVGDKVWFVGSSGSSSRVGVVEHRTKTRAKVNHIEFRWVGAFGGSGVQTPRPASFGGGATIYALTPKAEALATVETRIRRYRTALTRLADKINGMDTGRRPLNMLVSKWNSSDRIASLDEKLDKIEGLLTQLGALMSELDPVDVPSVGEGAS